MRIVVFGANGGTGREIVKQSLIRGLETTAFVRDASSLEPASRLTIVQGDALDADAVEQALEGCSAVLSVLGNRAQSPHDLLPRAITNVIAAMGSRRIRRLVVLCAAGAVDMNEALQHQSVGTKMMFRTMAATVMSQTLRDHAEYERVITASDLDYTIVHAARLLDEPQSGSYRVGEDGLPQGATSISRADVAEFMLDQLDTDKYVRKHPYVGV
jgi:putative NADH-flavin reductase